MCHLRMATQTPICQNIGMITHTPIYHLTMQILAYENGHADIYLNEHAGARISE